jgi:hypothetical protein
LSLPGLELRPLSCLARRQSLYRLRHPDSDHKIILQLSMISVRPSSYMAVFCSLPIIFSDEKYADLTSPRLLHACLDLVVVSIVVE